MSDELKAAALIAAAQIVKFENDDDPNKRIFGVASVAHRILQSFEAIENKKKEISEVEHKSKGRGK